MPPEAPLPAWVPPSGLAVVCPPLVLPLVALVTPPLVALVMPPTAAAAEVTFVLGPAAFDVEGPTLTSSSAAFSPKGGGSGDSAAQAASHAQEAAAQRTRAPACREVANMKSRLPLWTIARDSQCDCSAGPPK